jgi:PAS domain-containing protein
VRILLVSSPPGDGSLLAREVADDLRSLGLVCEHGSAGTWVAHATGHGGEIDADIPRFAVTADEEHLPRALESGFVDAVVWPRDRAALPFRIMNALRLAEERAQASFLRELLDACPDAVLVKSMNGEVLYANESACAMHGPLDETHRAELIDPSGRRVTAVFARPEDLGSARRLRTG